MYLKIQCKQFSTIPSPQDKSIITPLNSLQVCKSSAAGGLLCNTRMMMMMIIIIIIIRHRHARMCSAGRAIWRRAVTFLAPDCRRIRFFADGTRLVCAAITPVNSSTDRPRVLSVPNMSRRFITIIYFV